MLIDAHNFTTSKQNRCTGHYRSILSILQGIYRSLRSQVITLAGEQCPSVDKSVSIDFIDYSLVFKHLKCSGIFCGFLGAHRLQRCRFSQIPFCPAPSPASVPSRKYDGHKNPAVLHAMRAEQGTSSEVHFPITHRVSCAYYSNDRCYTITYCM